MRSDRRNIGFFSLIVALSVIGLVIAQYILLRRTLSLESDLFSQNVTSVIGSVVQKIENREAFVRISRVIVDGTAQGRIQRSDTAIDRQSERILSVADNRIEPRVRVLKAAGGPAYDQSRHKTGKIHVIMSDSDGTVVDTLLDDSHETSRYLLSMDREIRQGGDPSMPPDSLGIILCYEQDSVPAGSSFDLTFDNRRIILNKVLDDLCADSVSSVLQRIEPSYLDSLIGATMAEKGIKTDFEFGIYSASLDSFLIARPSSAAGSLKDSEYRARFFPHDLMVVEDYLVLAFPDKNLYLMKQAGFMALSVFIFLSVIIYSSASFARLLIRQRRFHGLLVDFINNMTHEFKTPVSTISIAGEAISSSGTEMTAEKRHRYGRILQDESRRMRLQIERILQMAALEKGDLEMNMESTDVHRLIEDAVENHAIRFEAAGGTLSTRFEASFSTAQVDRVHFTNIINNLLDNAVKYTRGKPEVTVLTRSDGGRMTISVEDNGIGITHEQKERIFDKYYRVPTGNIHDVKGFGLGLSYVKMIVEAHGGRIIVDSHPGQGSTFSIILPTRIVERS